MIHFATVWWFLQTKHTLFFFYHLFFSWRKTALQYCAGFCCEVTQSCLTLCDPMDHSLPGSSVHGIFQARLLEWAAISQIRHNYTYTTSFLSLSVLPLSHPSKLSQRAKLGTLCYIATSHLLSISHSSIYIRRRQWHPTPGLLPGKSHGQRSLVGCSPCGRKESETTERLHFHFSL